MKKKTKDQLNTLTAEVVEKILKNVDLSIERIILYGSYAKGDADDESDVDIMILCNDEESEVRKRRKITSHIGSDIGLNNDIYISIKLQDKDTFEKWKDVLPFYQNVLNDGVVLYE